MKRSIPFLVAAGLLAAGCSTDTTSTASSDSPVAQTAETITDATVTDESDMPISDGVRDPTFPDGTALSDTVTPGEMSEYQIEVWADNWMAVYVDGELIGEDSVPITVERSFNAETFTFRASTPFTLAIEAKDFMETNSGIEYIGQPNQQMGDGGLIAQVTDLATGQVVAGTDSELGIVGRPAGPTQHRVRTGP